MCIQASVSRWNPIAPPTLQKILFKHKGTQPAYLLIPPVAQKDLFPMTLDLLTLALEMTLPSLCSSASNWKPTQRAQTKGPFTSQRMAGTFVKRARSSLPPCMSPFDLCFSSSELGLRGCHYACNIFIMKLCLEVGKKKKSLTWGTNE